MQVSAELLNKWKLMTDHGDVTKISRKTGLSAPTIRKILKDGVGSRDNISKVQSFFNKEAKFFSLETSDQN